MQTNELKMLLKKFNSDGRSDPTPKIPLLISFYGLSGIHHYVYQDF